MKKITIKDCPINLSGIYKIDFPNNKSYIGKAVDIKRRMTEHNTDLRQPILYAAIQKYFNGDIQEFFILEENVPREKLNERERYYIALYQSNNKELGYNLTEGGDGAALGLDNVASKFTQEDLDNIINLLQTTDVPMYQIAESYNCSRATIERLNSGETYYNQNLTYPIRKNKYVPKSGCQNGNSSLTEEQLANLINDLKDMKLSNKDITLKYNICQTTLTNINNGRAYYDNNISYPIRKRNESRARVFTLEELLLIKELLMQDKKQVTMTDIGNKINCDRKVISDINKGVRQPQEGWSYPIRK